MSPAPVEEKPSRRTEGARLLKRYIDETKDNVSAFATRAGLKRLVVMRVIAGERWGRITVDFALRVREATKGLIPVEAWRSETARKVRG